MSDNTAMVLILVVLAFAIMGCLAVVARTVVQVVSIRTGRPAQPPPRTPGKDKDDGTSDYQRVMR